MNDKIFRAYDIRGKYPDEINEDIFYVIGQSYGSYLQEKYHICKCIVSHDNRISSPSLTDSFIKGVTSTGCNILYLGQTTTPMNYFARYIFNTPGAMITASHNPKDDNGIKFSFEGMINARGDMITDFLDYTLKGKFKKGMGLIKDADIFDKYYDYLYNSIKFGNIKRKVVFDPGNGVGSDFLKKVFNSKYFDSIYINEKSDGTFPNHHPDPSVKENMKDLQKAVTNNHADFGIAFDGDADRIGIVMDNGDILPIEYFMNICIADMFDKVDNKTFLYDIKCSKSVDDYIKSLGGKPYCYRTGASYTEYETHQKDIPFGCEYSGHVYFQDRTFDCCSAFYAALRFIEIFSKNNNRLSEIVKNYNHYYATEEIKIPSDDKMKFEVANKVLLDAKEKGLDVNDIDGVRITFDDGWALVRASNTGPNITFRCEATSKERLEIIKNEYLEMINKYNGD